jgi:hypothetical protein
MARPGSPGRPRMKISKRRQFSFLVDPCAQPPGVVHFFDIAELEFLRHVSFGIWIDIVGESASTLGQSYKILSEFNTIGIYIIDPVLAIRSG